MVVWVFAVASAVGGVITGQTGTRLSLGLYAAAVALGVVVAALLLLSVVRRRRARARTPAAPAVSALSRLDYLPSVTSRAPRLRWRGDQYWAIGQIGDPADLTPGEERDLIGSAAAPPLQGQPDGVREAGVAAGVDTVALPDAARADS
jgi:hypothetical protein